MVVAVRMVLGMTTCLGLNQPGLSKDHNFRHVLPPIMLWAFSEARVNASVLVRWNTESDIEINCTHAFISEILSRRQTKKILHLGGLTSFILS